MNYYLKSLREFKRVLKKNKNITKEEWDKYANENIFFSSITLQARNKYTYFASVAKKEGYKDVRDFESLKRLYCK